MAGTADKILEHLLETRIGKECDSTGIQSNKTHTVAIFILFVTNTEVCTLFSALETGTIELKV